MTYPLSLRSSKFTCALALAAMPSSALAELSAQDVWKSFSKQMSAYGAMQADVSKSGGTLTAGGIVLQTEADEMRSETALLGDITFQENADGTVSIQFPNEMTATLNVTGANASPVSMTYRFSHQGMDVTASGQPGNISHAFSAPTLTYSLEDISFDNQPLDADLELTVSNIAGSWVTAGSSLTDIDAEYTIEAMSVMARFAEAKKGDGAQFNIQVQDIAAQSQNSIPAGT